MNIVSMTQDSLTEAIRCGDPRRRNAALKELYMDATFNIKIKEWVQVYGNVKQEPDDILQQGIILLDESIRKGKFKGQSKVKTYLLGICKNLIRADVRKVDRITYKEEVPDHEDLVEESPEEQIVLVEIDEEQQKRDKALHEILAKMKDNCRIGLKLYYFKSMPMKKIAVELGLKNDNQAKKAINRCRKKLRSLIGDNPLFTS